MWIKQKGSACRLVWRRGLQGKQFQFNATQIKQHIYIITLNRSQLKSAQLELKDGWKLLLLPSLA